jgi:hypothetical protein
MMFALGAPMALNTVGLAIVYEWYEEQEEEQDSRNEWIRRGGR